MIHWFDRAFYYDWDFTWGHPMKSTNYIGWKKQNKHSQSSLQEDTNSAATPVTPEGIAALKKDGPGVTYEDLQKEKPEQTPPVQQDTSAGSPNTEKKRQFPWRRYILNRAFGNSLLEFLSRLLYHSHIRHLKLSGILGLGQPHETGILAGIIYALLSHSTNDLTFNFLAEEYDCTVQATGRMYPAVLLAYTTTFAVSQPVRSILAYWYHTKRGIHHG
jgi:hypothetical protein